jgi:hypothetical protein
MKPVLLEVSQAMDIQIHFSQLIQEASEGAYIVSHLYG